MHPSQYRGLVNQGSTCYLNSLLQTLFMTTEFRENVYNYVLDQRKISAVDSIPFQLQKLFVQLQLNQKSVYTKGLLRSFQWDRITSFQQHDVQQFCRILFQALATASKGNNWISKLYSGILESYLSCGAHPRSNQQLFMDISLPIRSQFTQTCFQSIQQCLREYLRPQTLEDKVECEKCGGKVVVEKGLRLNALPPILTLQVNRFELNYNTLQRQKVNSFVYFPEILQMWRFLIPFEKIQLKGIPNDLFSKMTQTAQQKSSKQPNQQKQPKPKIPRKKSFDKQSQKETVKFFDEENQDKRQDKTKKPTPEEDILRNKQILKELKADHEKLYRLKSEEGKEVSGQIAISQKCDQKNEFKQVDKSKISQKVAPASTSIDDDMLFGTFMDGFDRTGNYPQLNNFQEITVTNETLKPKNKTKFQKTQIIFDHEQEQFDPNKQYPNNTYVLFAVLVHSGSAYGGHYYAYIFNGINWYCFNDSNVYKVSRQEIRKYGNPNEDSHQKANAYLLFYRQSKTFKNILLPIEIPPLVLDKVKNDKNVVAMETQQKMYEKKVQTKLNLPQNNVIIKIKYKNNELSTIKIFNPYEHSIKQLKKQIKQQLKIEQQDKNWRLRRYNKTQDTMHEIYDSSWSNKTLQEVGIRQIVYLAVQVKKDQEQFGDYDPKNITIKLNIWRDGLTLLTQSCLKPIKMLIQQQKTFEIFYHEVQQITKINHPLVIKRSFTKGDPYQIYTLQNNHNKNLISLRFFNGINLYIEQPTPGKPKWQKQFEDEKYKCQILFNNPKTGSTKQLQLFFDTRKTFGQLKKKISEVIGLSSDQFRIKKSEHSVSQMTQYKKRLVDLRFVNSEYLFIEEGRSSKGSILIKKGIVNIIDDQIDFEFGEQFQVEIQSNTTVLDLKEKLAQKYNLPKSNIRIRQFKACHFGQILTNSQNLQKTKQKSLIWEQTQIEDCKGIQIYVRFFNHLTLELGPLFSIFIQPNANYQQLSLILQEETQIKSDQILAYKITGNFIDKGLLCECSWIEIKYIRKFIKEPPLYLSIDGEILIIKQSEIPYQPKNIINQAIGNSLIIMNKQVQKNENKRQTGLKITVVHQKQDQQLIKQQQIEKDLQTNFPTNGQAFQKQVVKHELNQPIQNQLK